MPVRFHGNPGGLNATVQPIQIGKILTEQRLRDSWCAAILDRTGTIVAVGGSHRTIRCRARSAGATTCFGHSVAIPIRHFREAIELRDALVDAGNMLDKAPHSSHLDPLTGLANRARFDDVVDHQLTLCKRFKREMAVLFIDLDGFKAANDTHGHGFGDELLRKRCKTPSPVAKIK